MPINRQLAYWGAGAAVALVLIWLLGSALSPFAAGLAVAYLLTPLVGRVERLGLGRTAATVVVVASVLIIGGAALALSLPVALSQASQMIEGLPAAVTNLAAWIDGAAARIAPELFGASGALEQATAALHENAQDLGLNVAKRVWSGGAAAIDILIVLVITPVVVFYLLADWPRLTATLDAWLPREHAPTIRRIVVDINSALAGFVRGQVTVCLILGSFYAIALTVIGLNYGLLAGLLAGVFSFIPFVGAIFGFALSMSIALAQFGGDWTSIGLVAGVFLFGQAVEGNFLTPKLMGAHVGLHPLWLIFAMSAFGALFGFVGVLIAVPTAAALGVLAKYGVSQYLDSDLYKGCASGAAADSAAPAQTPHE